MIKARRIVLCGVMIIAAVGVGLFVTIIAQDTQELQRHERLLKKEVAQDAERIKVLQAEWAYLTRPDYLVQIVSQVEGDGSDWRIMKGADMVASRDLRPVEASRLASASVDAGHQASKAQ